MTLILQLNGQPLGAVETLEVAQEGQAESWLVAIHVSAPTPAQAEQAVAAIQNRIGESGSITLLAGGTVVRELAAQDCRQGPTLAEARAIAAMPGAAHAPRRLKLRLAAMRQNAALAVQSHEFTVQLRVQAGQAPELLTRGRIVLRAGEAAAAHEGEIAAPPQGWRRVRALITRDAGLEYETLDQQVFAPLPAGVEDGQLTRATHKRADGRRVQIIRGHFVGPGALARALELAPAQPLESRVQQDAAARRVDFEFQAVDSEPHTTRRVESISFATTRRVIDHALLGNQPGWRQQVGASFTEIIQQGSASGQGRHPQAPAPMFLPDLVQRSVEYALPDAAGGHVTKWRYVMRSRGEVAAVPPATQGEPL